jgi:N-formylmaleamate deformylase
MFRFRFWVRRRRAALPARTFGGASRRGRETVDHFSELPVGYSSSLEAEDNMKRDRLSLRQYLLPVSLAFLTFAGGWPVSGKAATAASNAPASTPQQSQAYAFRVQVAGHGEPMILIPGLSSSGATWNDTVAHFKDRYTCYVLTLAGFAGVPPVQPPLLSKVRDDIATLIRERHLEKPVIVGHSLGGNIALDLAAHYPTLIGPVVIVDSLPFYAGAWFHAKNLDQAKPMIAQMRQGMESTTEAQWEANERSGAMTKYMVTSPVRLHETIQWGLASDRHTVTNAMIELVSEDLRPELAQITSPVLVLGTWIGWRDEMQQRHITVTRAVFVDAFKDQYASLSHLHFVMSDTARHFIMFDDPNWFYAQLDHFLSDPMAATKDRGFAAGASH